MTRHRFVIEVQLDEEALKDHGVPTSDADERGLPDELAGWDFGNLARAFELGILDPDASIAWYNGRSRPVPATRSGFVNLADDRGYVRPLGSLLVDVDESVELQTPFFIGERPIVIDVALLHAGGSGVVDVAMWAHDEEGPGDQETALASWETPLPGDPELRRIA